MNEEYLKLLQRNTAKKSVSASTARRMGPEGTIDAARDFLANIDLSRFQTLNEKDFRNILEQVTCECIKELPQTAQHWGSARKFLNIFLRDVVYNKYLCEAYKLDAIEPWLEVPLDRQVTSALRKVADGHNLPRLESVIRLDSATNRTYQEFASAVANKDGVLRVHLDLKYWRPTQPKAKKS